ncbi:MAG: hypothetical protein LBF63_03270, partial [Treponema sp.]|nr:hypothetical protein [Treponema sp.]
IRNKRDLSFLFIAHDLRVACYFCDRIGVMYQGELMEEAPAASLYREARHPYTRLLFSSVSGNKGEAVPAAGNPVAGNPALGSPVPGTPAPLAARTPPAAGEDGAPLPRCPFAPRCVLAEERCFAEHPEIGEIAPGHKIRCFRVDREG